MIREDRRFGFALTALMFAVPGMAGEGVGKNLVTKAAPLSNLHTAQLDLDARARKRASAHYESSQLFDVTPGLAPLPFPKNTDVRARLLTPELRRTPVVGWIAANLYRDKKENGWCLEADPGEGKYIVFYRVHL